MNNYRNLNEILGNWGSSKKKLPAKNDALKSEILAKMPTLQYSSGGVYPTGSGSKWVSLSFGFAALSVVVIISTISSGVSAPVEMKKDASNQMYAENTARSRDEYDDYGYNVPVTDTREFLKTYYGATIRTRHISNTGAKIEVIVRGAGGRVDSSSLQDEHGYLNFSIPADKFPLFRDQIKSLTHARLLSESISSENLLPQKQSIEERQEENRNTLATLKEKRANLFKNHTASENYYTQRMNTIKAEENILLAEWGSATSKRQREINARLVQLSAEKSTLENNKNTDNKNYKNNLSQIDQQIKWAEENMNYLQIEDQNFVANIYTVNGSIALNKISLWGIADLYTPGPLLAWLLALGAALSYYRYRPCNFVGFVLG